MKKALLIPLLILLVLIIALIASGLYTITEGEQAIITQFGKPIGSPRTHAGLWLKIPFIQVVNRLEARILEWDGAPTDMPTKDKLYISVDTFARWRITDPLPYFLRLRDERSAQSRLDDILGSEIRTAVARHELIEIIRTTQNREPLREDAVTGKSTAASSLVPIHKGRAVVEKEIVNAAAPKLKIFGIELLDVRFKRINYNEGVRAKIYDRMISERKQIAERFRSEGNGEAARILGSKERDLQRIQSEAYQQVETIKGDADAKATEIYTGAYNQSPEAVAFYGFLKTMETYEKVIGSDTTLILSTGGPIFSYLKSPTSESEPKPRDNNRPPAS